MSWAFFSFHNCKWENTVSTTCGFILCVSGSIFTFYYCTSAKKPPKKEPVVLHQIVESNTLEKTGTRLSNVTPTTIAPLTPQMFLNFGPINQINLSPLSLNNVPSDTLSTN